MQGVLEICFQKMQIVSQGTTKRILLHKHNKTTVLCNQNIQLVEHLFKDRLRISKPMVR